MKKHCSYQFWTPLPLYKKWEMVSSVDKLDIEARSYQAIGYSSILKRVPGRQFKGGVRNSVFQRNKIY